MKIKAVELVRVVRADGPAHAPGAQAGSTLSASAAPARVRELPLARALKVRKGLRELGREHHNGAHRRGTRERALAPRTGTGTATCRVRLHSPALDHAQHAASHGRLARMPGGVALRHELPDALAALNVCFTNGNRVP